MGILAGFTLIDHTVINDIKIARYEAREIRLHETLTKPRQILDSTLPAGTEVYWTSEERAGFHSLQLPQPTRIFGLLFVGSLENDSQSNQWEGELAEDQMVEGWSCRKGKVTLHYSDDHADEYHLPFWKYDCVLAADHRAYGLVIPAGSQLALLSNDSFTDFQLPEDRTMALPAWKAMAPALTTLSMRHGRIEYADLPDGKVMRVFGVPCTHVNLGYPEKGGEEDKTAQANRLEGLLAPGFTCKGHTFLQGSDVQISLASRMATVTEMTPDLSSGRFIDISSCLAR